MKLLKKINVEIRLKKNKILQMFLCVVGAVGVFISLIYLEKNLMAPNGLSEVIVAKKDISENQLITESNYNEFFEIIKRDSTTISNSSLKDSGLIMNKVLKNSLIKGNSISSNDLLDKDSLLASINNPVEYSIMASDIGQVVGGTIREGDIINIGIVDETSKEYIEAKEYAYVEKVLKSDATEVQRMEDGAAVVINIITSKEDKANIESKIAKGKLAIAKVKDLSSIK